MKRLLVLRLSALGDVIHTIPAVMGAFWETYGFRWGGNYSGTQDWMHMEFMGTPAQAAEYLGQLEGGDDDVNLETYQKGWDAYVVAFKSMNADPGPPKPDKSAWFRNGWNAARFSGNNPKP